MFGRPFFGHDPEVPPPAPPKPPVVLTEQQAIFLYYVDQVLEQINEAIERHKLMAADSVPGTTPKLWD